MNYYSNFMRAMTMDACRLNACLVDVEADRAVTDKTRSPAHIVYGYTYHIVNEFLDEVTERAP